ncbi:hypothetical protein THAOC_03756, partial [Thalassiosira oceanica]
AGGGGERREGRAVPDGRRAGVPPVPREVGRAGPRRGVRPPEPIPGVGHEGPGRIVAGAARAGSPGGTPAGGGAPGVGRSRLPLRRAGGARGDVAGGPGRVRRVRREARRRRKRGVGPQRPPGEAAPLVGRAGDEAGERPPAAPDAERAERHGRDDGPADLSPARAGRRGTGIGVRGGDGEPARGRSLPGGGGIRGLPGGPARSGQREAVGAPELVADPDGPTRRARNRPPGGFIMSSRLRISCSSLDATLLALVPSSSPSSPASASDARAVLSTIEFIVPATLSSAPARDGPPPPPSRSPRWSVWARKRAAQTSPVPVNWPGSLGVRIRCCSATSSPPAPPPDAFPLEARRHISSSSPSRTTLVISTSPTPLSWIDRHARWASWIQPILIPVSCSTSNWLGVSTSAWGGGHSLCKSERALQGRRTFPYRQAQDRRRICNRAVMVSYTSPGLNNRREYDLARPKSNTVPAGRVQRLDLLHDAHDRPEERRGSDVPRQNVSDPVSAKATSVRKETVPLHALHQLQQTVSVEDITYRKMQSPKRRVTGSRVFSVTTSCSSYFDFEPTRCQRVKIMPAVDGEFSGQQKGRPTSTFAATRPGQDHNACKAPDTVALRLAVTKAIKFPARIERSVGLLLPRSTEETDSHRRLKGGGLNMSEASRSRSMPSTGELLVSTALPLIVTWLSKDYASGSDSSQFALFLTFGLLESTWGNLFRLLVLPVARAVARGLPGASVPASHDELLRQEDESNDASLSWPPPGALAGLPPEWVAGGYLDGREEVSAGPPRSGGKKARSSKRKPDKEINKSSPRRPYHLNHVRGSTRIRHASQRLGAALGTLFATYLICSSSPLVSFGDIGLGLSSPRRAGTDLLYGFLVGSIGVTLIFAIELRQGWIKIISHCSTAAPGEVFAVNFLWDILFHVSVSTNEEVFLRSWMFVLGCRGIASSMIGEGYNAMTAVNVSIAASTLLQSSFFSLMHYNSPGASRQSQINLFVGGVVGTFNVIASGSIWLGIGWHFGWNIFMGHILGRSTSGIPMSCAVFDVIPKPGKSFERLHGGEFGPEQGVLAPWAYGFCMVLILLFYASEVGFGKNKSGPGLCGPRAALICPLKNRALRSSIMELDDCNHTLSSSTCPTKDLPIGNKVRNVGAYLDVGITRRIFGVGLRSSALTASRDSVADAVMRLPLRETSAKIFA